MTTKRQVSLHGSRAYLTKDDQIGAAGGFVGGGGMPGRASIALPGSPDIVALFDDFVGDTGRSLDNTDPTWRIFKADTGAVVSIRNSTGGVLRLATGATPTEQAKLGISAAMQWKGNQGAGPNDGKAPVRLAARVRISDTGFTKCAMWMGFTDTNVAEAPVIDTGGAIVSVATNAVGIGFSNRGSGDTGLVAYAVNGDTNRTPVVLDTGYTLGKYVDLEVAIHHGPSDTGGTATFYVNGEPKGSISSPLGMAIPLAPQILFWSDTGGMALLDIDWVNVSGPRDTGL